MKIALVLVLLLTSQASFSGTWCSINNFDLAVTGRFVAVYGTTLDENGAYVFLGDLDTQQGRAIHSLLLTAATAKKAIAFGDNSMSYACGQLPAYSGSTANPEYIRIKTKE